MSAVELGNDFDLLKMVNRGTLPTHYLEENPRFALEGYVGDYLKEEILAEGLSRNLPHSTLYGVDQKTLGSKSFLIFVLTQLPL
jgi:hypothetical protein